MEGRACDTSWTLGFNMAAARFAFGRGCGDNQEGHSHILLLEDTSHSNDMKTYGKRSAPYNKKSYQERRANAESTEWDIRIDIDEEQGLTPDALINDFVIPNIEKFEYVAIGNVERPDPNGGKARADGEKISEEDHVHVAVVLHTPLVREEVMKLLRGPKNWTGPNGEYCVPRNKKYPYVGWVVHHAKSDWKKNGEGGLAFEHGLLPKDDSKDVKKVMQVCRMIEKFGTDQMKTRFQYWINRKKEILAEEKAARKSTKLEYLPDKYRQPKEEEVIDKYEKSLLQTTLD